MSLPKYLNKESKGYYVLLIQLMLKLGGYEQISSLIKLDGVLEDEGTQIALKAFQIEQGIEVDGNCGPQTQEFLEKRFRIELKNIPQFHSTLFVQPNKQVIVYPDGFSIT